MSISATVEELKNAVFWDVTTCGLERTHISEERIASIIRVTKG
jgi:hypothetical protein